MKRHQNSTSQIADIRTQMQLGINASGNLSNFKFDKNVARKEIVDFIVRAELPFTFIEKHDFCGMIQRAIQPQFSSFSARTCKRDVLKMFSKSKSDLLNFFSEFDGKVSLTSDVCLAKDLLVVPASTVASEAAFSDGGRVVNEKRADLSPNTIEALIYLKDWSLAAQRKQESARVEEVAEALMNLRTARLEWMVDEEESISNPTNIIGEELNGEIHLAGDATENV
ncbi:hypothetical protein QQ045_006755 [Rhodiola kirilowii]